MGDFLSRMTLKFDGCPWKTIWHLFYTTSTVCIISKPSVYWNWSYFLETLNFGSQLAIFVPCDLEIWRMTLQNKMAPLLCYFKLSASFNGHGWIKTGVTVKKRPILRKNQQIFFDGWPWKTIKHPLMPHEALCIISSWYVNSNWS